MSIIPKQSIILENETFFLLNVDNENTKYYIRCIETADQIGSHDAVYTVKEDRTIAPKRYDEYFRNLDQITCSTLTDEELIELEELFKIISRLKSIYRLHENSAYGTITDTNSADRFVENLDNYKRQMLDHYASINDLFR